LTEFKQAAVVAKLKVDYSALREAVSARVRKDHPEWSEYDLEALYDRFYEADAEISALIVSVCDSSPKSHNEKKSAVQQ
jgi:uncharacterized phage-like protein YoqJ